MSIHSASGIVRCSLSFLFNNKIIVVIGAALATVPYFIRDWLYKSIMRTAVSMDAFYSEVYLPKLILSISEYVLLSLFTILVTLYAYHRLKNEHVSIATVFKTAMKHIIAVIVILLVTISFQFFLNKIAPFSSGNYFLYNVIIILLEHILLFFVSLILYTALLIAIIKNKNIFNGFLISLQSYGTQLRTLISLFFMYVVVKIVTALPLVPFVITLLMGQDAIASSELLFKISTIGIVYALVVGTLCDQLLVAVMAAAFYANYDKLKTK